MRRRLLYTASLALLLALGAAACGDEGGDGAPVAAAARVQAARRRWPATKAALTKGDIHVAVIFTSMQTSP